MFDAVSFAELIRDYLTDPEWAEVDEKDISNARLFVKLPDGTYFTVQVEPIENKEI